MAVIIGSATQVVIDGGSDGFQSIQWSIQVQNNRLWSIGNWNPYGTQVLKTFNEQDMFIMSYSYSKGDPNAFGTESWSFQKWVDSEVTGADIINTVAPTAVIQGITEGNYTADSGLNVGMTLSSEQQVSGFQGDISAGFPGVGQANTITYGIVTNIGGGDLEKAGKLGNSSASIPHQPIYA